VPPARIPSDDSIGNGCRLPFREGMREHALEKLATSYTGCGFFFSTVCLICEVPTLKAVVLPRVVTSAVEPFVPAV